MSSNRFDIYVNQGNQKTIVQGKEGDSIYKILCDNNLYIDAVCAGDGTCGKCKIKLLEGTLLPSKKDKRLLSEREQQEGICLACQAYPADNCTIQIAEKEQCKTEVQTGHYKRKTENYGIAIDIGTTTVACQIVDIRTGQGLNSATQLNHNRMYGADVMRRIDAANRGTLRQMSIQLREQLRDMLDMLQQKMDEKPPVEIVIVANTTMIHILMNESCEMLGKYPFAPVLTDWIDTDTIELNLTDRHIPITIFPSISAFIGGDILAGLSELNPLALQKSTLFLDLGTNGEIALMDSRGRLFVSSTSVGPAFEGGDISCGTGGVSGAIQKIEINGNVKYETINEQLPTGICGSGIIELIFEMRKNNLIDETGLLVDAYFENGYQVYQDEEKEIVINQNDIRELQMAKAAIAAGVEVLSEVAEMKAGEIQDVYLAGGFGNYLSIKKAIGIGLLRKEWKSGIHFVGNSALSGAKDYLLHKTDKQIIDRIKGRAKEIYLSNIPQFEKYYLRNMFLPDIDERD